MIRRRMRVVARSLTANPASTSQQRGFTTSPAERGLPKLHAHASALSAPSPANRSLRLQKCERICTLRCKQEDADTRLRVARPIFFTIRTDETQGARISVSSPFLDDHDEPEILLFQTAKSVSDVGHPTP